MTDRTQNKTARQIKPQQEGAILFISLIILLLITLIAIGSTRLSTINQRISLTYQLQNSAFQAADSALNDTQRLLEQSEFDLQRATTGTLQKRYQYAASDNNNNLQTEAETSTKLREKLSDSGNSLGIGKGLPQVFLYETTSTARVSGYDITIELEQGYQVRNLNQ